MDLRQVIGNKIKDYRLKANISGKELAQKLNVTQPTLSNWERGLHYPDIPTLYNIAKIFNIKITDLLGIETEKKRTVIKYSDDLSSLIKVLDSMTDKELEELSILINLVQNRRKRKS